MVEFQHHVVAFLAAAATFLDLGGHGARHHVAAGEVLGVGRVALHEALAVLVQQVAALAAHALGDQDPRAVDAGGMELVELHVLQGNAGACRDSEAVAGVDEGVGRAVKHAPRSAGGENRRLALQDHHLAGFHLHGDHAEHRAFGVAHQIERHPFDEKLGIGPDVVLVRAYAASRARCGPPRRTRASPSSRCRSPACGRRTGAGRSCRSPAGRTACPCARARPRLRPRAGTCIRSRPGRPGSPSP